MPRKKSREERSLNFLLQHRETALSKLKASFDCSYLQIEWQSNSSWAVSITLSNQYQKLRWQIIAEVIKVKHKPSEFLLSLIQMEYKLGLSLWSSNSIIFVKHQDEILLITLELYVPLGFKQAFFIVCKFFLNKNTRCQRDWHKLTKELVTVT